MAAHPGLVVVGVLYVLGVTGAAVTTFATYRYVASPGLLFGTAAVAAVLIAVGVRLAARTAPTVRPTRPSGPDGRRRAPSPWVIGPLAAIGTSVLVLAPSVPGAVGSTATFLTVEVVAAVAVTIWSRRPGWGDRQILALTAAALFAYAWRAFFATPAFDTAPILLIRISNVVFAALTLAAVVAAAHRLPDDVANPNDAVWREQE